MDNRGPTYVSDRQLLVRVADGDTDALGVLFRRWRPRLVAFFRRRQVHVDDAEDLADGCLEVVWRRRDAFEPTSPSGAAWIFGIARRELARHRRQKATEARATERLTVVIDLTDDSGFEAVEDRADAEAASNHLQMALETLPPAERDAVSLRILQQHTYPEIAQLLGCSEAAARQRVSRGLRRLRSALEGSST